MYRWRCIVWAASLWCAGRVRLGLESRARPWLHSRSWIVCGLFSSIALHMFVVPAIYWTSLRGAALAASGDS